MAYFKPFSYLFRKNIAYAVCLVLLIVFSVYCLYVSYLYKQNAELPLSTLLKAERFAELYYSVKPGGEDAEKIKSAARDGAEVFGITAFFGSCRGYGISPELFAVIPYVLSEGEVRNSENGTIYGLARADSGYKVGQTADFNGIKVEISGILADNSLIADFGKGGSPFTADLLFSSAKEEGSPFVCFPYSAEDNLTYAGYISLNGALSAEDFTASFSENATVLTIDTICDNTRKMTNETLTVFYPLIVASAALLLITLISLSLFIFENNKKYFGIVLSTGAGKGHIYLSVAALHLVICLTAGLFVLITRGAVTDTFFAGNLYYEKGMMTPVYAGYAGAYMIISSGITFLKLYNNDTETLLRREIL